MTFGAPQPHETFLFTGYARLPQSVSPEAVQRRVGVIVEVDGRGRVLACSSTLVTDLAREFLARLLIGLSVIDDRDEMEALIRRRYRAQCQGALIFALRKVFETVDQSVLVLGEGAEDGLGECEAGVLP
jgi:hypothetical protein